MAADKRAATIADEDEEFDSAQLTRLAAWGVAAVVAVTAVVFAGRSELGSRRAYAAYAAITSSPNDPAPAVVGQLLARTAEVERETRRLTDTFRSLSGERDRLTLRLGMVEREMGDLTGSITRQAKGPESKPVASPASPSPNAAPPAISAPPVILAPATVEAKSVRTVTAPPLPALSEPQNATSAEAARALAATASLPETVPMPAPRPSDQMIQATAGGQQVAAAPTGNIGAPPQAAAPPANSAAEPARDGAKSEPEETETQPTVEIGIDLGPALTIARLRARWTAFKSAHGTLADGLRPVMSIREVGQSKPVEMRLVVGPVANVRAAAAICAALSGSQFMCQPAIFDGQRLALK